MTPTQQAQVIDMINEVGLTAMLDVVADALDVESETYYENVSGYAKGDKLQTYARVVRTIRNEV